MRCKREQLFANDFIISIHCIQLPRTTNSSPQNINLTSPKIPSIDPEAPYSLQTPAEEGVRDIPPAAVPDTERIPLVAVVAVVFVSASPLVPPSFYVF